MTTKATAPTTGDLVRAMTRVKDAREALQAAIHELRRLLAAYGDE